MGLSMQERQAGTKQMARRYERASKVEKGLMLDGACWSSLASSTARRSWRSGAARVAVTYLAPS